MLTYFCKDYQDKGTTTVTSGGTAEISWDGNTTGKESIAFENQTLYKLSDYHVSSSAEFTNQTMKQFFEGEEQIIPIPTPEVFLTGNLQEFAQDMGCTVESGDADTILIYDIFEGGIYVVSSPSAQNIKIAYEGAVQYDVQVSSSGIYLRHRDQDNYVSYISYGTPATTTTKNLIYAELYTDSATGSSITVEASQVTNLPAIYDPTKVQFAPGSYVYATSTGDVFIANNEGTFIKQ